MMDNSEGSSRQTHHTMKSTVNTERYEFSHGKKPRGKGLWAFAPAANTNAFWFASSNQSYAAACKQARAHFASQGVSNIIVCS
jgi:hypothetical protein